MKRVVYHITPRFTENGIEWAAKREGTQRAAVVVQNKLDAIQAARDILENYNLGQIKIHNKKNVIEREYTYGEDPEKYKG